MEQLETYTVTIVKNIGVPISFTIRRWKIFVYLTIFSVIFLALLYGSLNYLILSAKTAQLEDELSESQKTIANLTKQIAAKDQEGFAKNAQATGGITDVKKALLDQPEFSTEGIWISRKSGLSLEELQEGASLEITQIEPTLAGEDFKVVVRFKNTSSPMQALGGYIFVTLINEGQEPVQYKSLGGTLGESGFPSSYKSGRQFFLGDNSRERKITQKTTLGKEDNFFTGARVFVFSYKGRLLLKENFEFDEDLFPSRPKKDKKDEEQQKTETEDNTADTKDKKETVKPETEPKEKTKPEKEASDDKKEKGQ